MRSRCPKCGETYSQWDEHKCVTKSVTLMANKPKKVANIVANAPDVMANEPDEVANSPEPMANDVANTYRYRDADKRRAYMREYMRKKRESERAA